MNFNLPPLQLPARPLVSGSYAALLRGKPGYSQQIVHVSEQAARPARLATPPAEPLRESLLSLGITTLYSHQAQALEAARRGENVCVVTGTASGKSLCYLLPILETLSRDPNARALLLFPTKALLHDQRAALEQLAARLAISSAVYDGDSSTAERTAARNSRIVLSNPDMVHRGMIPYVQGGWGDFARNLRFVVIDEAHTYTGVFGGHVALVLRRLFRVCERAGNTPQVICCSATIANPQAHIRALTGVAAVTVITENGAPAGPREIIFWQTGARRAAEQDALGLLATLIREQKQTLLFVGNRQMSDRLLQRVAEEQPDLRDLIGSYRAGYHAAERRRIEAAMRAGELRGLISTNANELGVNIGALDVVLMLGYPGTVASFWQQAGRAGRSGQRAAAILIGGNSPLEAFYFAHPAKLLGAPVEPAHVPVDNANLLGDHLWCAARDARLKGDDVRWFGGAAGFKSGLANLVDSSRLVRTAVSGPNGQQAFRYALANEELFPALLVNLRNASTLNFTLVDERGQVVEQALSLSQVLHEAHPGAIYHSQFKIYRVDDVDFANQLVSSTQLAADPGYTTQANTFTTIDEQVALETKAVGAVQAAWGTVVVTERVVSYVVRPKGRGVPRELPLSMLPRQLATEALWWEVGPPLVKRLEESGHAALAAMDGLARLLLGLLPVFSQSDARDTATALYMSGSAAGEGGVITIYDDIEGGCGLTRRGIGNAVEWLEIAEQRLASCGCLSGCPACIHIGPAASRDREPDKAGALLLVRLMLGKEVPQVSRPVKLQPAPREIMPQPKQAPRPAARAAKAERSIEYARSRWPEVRGKLRASSESRLFEYVLAAEPVAIEGDTLVLDFGVEEDLARLFARPANRALMEDIFSRVLGYRYRLRCVAQGFDSE